jgi:hypothetical protein
VPSPAERSNSSFTQWPYNSGSTTAVQSGEKLTFTNSGD